MPSKKKGKKGKGFPLCSFPWDVDISQRDVLMKGKAKKGKKNEKKRVKGKSWKRSNTESMDTPIYIPSALMGRGKKRRGNERKRGEGGKPAPSSMKPINEGSHIHDGRLRGRKGGEGKKKRESKEKKEKKCRLKSRIYSALFCPPFGQLEKEGGGGGRPFGGKSQKEKDGVVGFLKPFLPYFLSSKVVPRRKGGKAWKEKKKKGGRGGGFVFLFFFVPL